MRIARKIIIRESGPAEGQRIFCAWDDCDRDAVDLHKAVVNHGTAATPYVVRYAFCTDRHKMFWVNSHRAMGKLPAGYRLTIV